MLIQNISIFNNQNKYNIQPQQRQISFEANKLKLTKEIILNTEQVEQLSFIADVYRKAIDYSAKLNGPYRYKFKECFPNLLAGEKRKGFIFEGLLPNKDRRLQVAKLDARSQEEVISLRIVDQEYNDLLTCRVNNDGKAQIVADDGYLPTFKTNPFERGAELNYDEFLSKLYVSFMNLKTYSENFTQISRKLKNEMNEQTVKKFISHIQAVGTSQGLKLEMDNLLSNYSQLDELLKTGRSTNAVMYKRMYFGEDYYCAKGILFKNVGPKGESYLYCPATSKDDDRVLRLVVSDSNGKTINGFVFFKDGKVMKQINSEGIKSEDFRVTNLATLSDTDIKNLKLNETMEIVDNNITAFRKFVAEKLQTKADKKLNRQAELAQSAQRREERQARKLENESVLQQKAEARAIKQKEKAELAEQKEARRAQREEQKQQKEIRREQRTEQKRQRELLREQKEVRRISMEERREEKIRKQKEKAKARLEAQRKREEAQEAARRQREYATKYLKKVPTSPQESEELYPKLSSSTPLKPTVRIKTAQKKEYMNAAMYRTMKHKEAEERRLGTIPAQIKQEIADSINELGAAPQYRAIPHTSCTNFLDCNLTKLVESIDTLFATPVEMRSPHLIHERLSDGRVFGAKVSMLASDGAKVTITRMKSPTYTDFSYYSITVMKDGQKYVVNLDPDFMRILETVNGKPFVDTKNMVRHISKQELLDDIPDVENLPKYFEEFFALKEDAEKVVVESDLKLRPTKKLVKKQLLEEAENDVLKALAEEDYSGFDNLLT